MSDTFSRSILDKALRGFMAHVDYDLHKNYECGEEDGEDTYHELVELFLIEWNAAVKQVLKEER